jgi:hypothetical protein
MVGGSVLISHVHEQKYGKRKRIQCKPFFREKNLHLDSSPRHGRIGSSSSAMFSPNRREEQSSTVFSLDHQSAAQRTRRSVYYSYNQLIVHGSQGSRASLKKGKGDDLAPPQPAPANLSTLKQDGAARKHMQSESRSFYIAGCMGLRSV